MATATATATVRVMPSIVVDVEGVEKGDMRAAQVAAIEMVKGMPHAALVSMVLESLGSHEACSYPHDFAEVMDFKED